MPYHYTTGAIVNRGVNTFHFYRFRFHFQGLDSLYFPAGKSANVVRGAFGSLLRTAAPGAYSRLFEPGAELGKTPSGLADWPRPFLFRTAHLDGSRIPAGGLFFIDVHVFDVRRPVLLHFREAFSQFAVQGLGPGRGRAELHLVEQLDLEDSPTPVSSAPGPPSALDLEPGSEPVDFVALRFVTPTELKQGGELAARPEFPFLYARLRDRLSTLRALYGEGPLDIDFRGSGELAAGIRLTRCELVHERAERKSGRTGQTHSLGGFTGRAEYEGELGGFMPWLHAARWAGVGRQTVWGKGDVRVVRAGK